MVSKIILNDKEYRLHPIYDLFGADEDGNILNFLTKRPVEDEPDGINVKVRNYQMKKPKKYKRIIFIWESYNGQIPEKTTVVCINKNESDNRLCNLKLLNITSKRLTSYERKRNDDYCKKRWREKVYICQKCGFKTSNNASWYHRKVCPQRL